MSMTATVYGRLGQDPKTITTKTGKPMATASVALQLDRDEPSKTTWLNLVAFGDLAGDLLLHHKGESLNVSGRVEVSHWRGNDGNERESLGVICDVIASAKTERARAQARPDTQRQASGPYGGIGDVPDTPDMYGFR